MTSKEYRYIGKATPRKDARDIVTGRANYINDIKVPRMLQGKVLRSPYAHANILNLETHEAKRLPGVKAVITFQDAPPGWKGGIPVPHKRILDRRVRFVGDAVALVAATTGEIAEAALDLIRVEYEVLPAVFDLDEAIKPGAPQLYEDFPNNTLPPGYTFFGPKSLKEVVRGDIEKGFKEADFIVEGTFGYENIPNPLPPEPPGLIAQWDGPGKITVLASTQCPGILKFHTAGMLRIPESRAIGVQCGGSYGSKNSPWVLMFYAAALAKVTGRPVKLCYTKEEHLGAFGVRVKSRVKAKIGMKKDGSVTAVSGKWLVDTGAFSDMTQAQMAVGCGEAQLMIAGCSNWHLTTKTIVTNRNPSGVVRGFGGQELKSALIPLWTIAMEEGDLDPFEVFKKNYVKPGDGYLWRDGKWVVCKGINYSKAMEKGAKVFGWRRKWRGWLRPTAVDNYRRTGVGVGIHGNADVGEDASEAYVKLSGDGRVILHSCVAETGAGERSSVCKMAAEVLNVPLEMVSMTDVDTLVNPFEFGIVGSRGTYAVGSAVINAAEEARKKLLALASQRLGEPPEMLETRDSWVHVKGQADRGISWWELMGRMRTVTGDGRFEPDYSKPNVMMTFVEVAVDIETGKTSLIRVVQATDAGQVIDPLNIQGQLYGGLGSAGIDSALFEETILDKKTGRILNANLIDYKWRTFKELPAFDNVILESSHPTHRFKAIGVGEIAAAPGPSAVLMAVSNAIGQRITEYPVTPERVLRVLGKG